MIYLKILLPAILICGMSVISRSQPLSDVDDNPVARMADSIMQLNIFQLNSQKLAKLQQDKFNYAADSIPVADPATINKRLAKLDAASPFRYENNEHVFRYIEMYSKRKRKQVERMLGLAQLYYPLFEEKLDKHGLPLELKHLAVVESALNAQAKSHAGAVGLWQFMYPTGKMFGLNTSSYMDERCDPYKATEAACLYLKSLYNMFGDWHLALAAYNAGPGTVNKAIRRSGGKTNYWELMPFLPSETNGYVPAFIAASYVMTYHKEHNLHPARPKYFFNEVDTVFVKKQVSLDQLSAALGVDKVELEFLNPAYHKNIIPANDKAMPFCLPASSVSAFLAYEPELYNPSVSPELKEQEIAFETKTVTRYHTVRKGEHLSLIARKYNCSITDIRTWNKLRSNSIYAGQKLKVLAEEQHAVVEKPKTSPESKASTPSSGYKVYTVQPGDTLWDIATRHNGLSVNDIIRLNDLRDADAIKPGMKLKIGTKG